MTRTPLARMAIAILALIGLFDAAYLSIERVLHGAQMYCPTGGGCTIVQSSSYSVILGVPVAYLGVLAYITILALALVGIQREAIGSVPVALALAVVTGVGVLFSAYLTYLQLAVIGAICFWCVVSAILQLTMFGLALLDIRAHRSASRRDQAFVRTPADLV